MLSFKTQTVVVVAGFPSNICQWIITIFCQPNAHAYWLKQITAKLDVMPSSTEWFTLWTFHWKIGNEFRAANAARMLTERREMNKFTSVYGFSWLVSLKYSSFKFWKSFKALSWKICCWIFEMPNHIRQDSNVSNFIPVVTYLTNPRSVHWKLLRTYWKIND